MVDEWRPIERPASSAVGHDVLDLRFGIAHRGQRRRKALVDDLEVAAACQFLELDQSEIRLDTGCVAVHDQTDRAGRSDHRGLSVAESIGSPEFKRSIPGPSGGQQQIRWAMLRLDALRCDTEALILFRRSIVRGTPMVPDDPKHVLAIACEALERSQFSGHLGRGGIGLAGQNRRDCPTEGQRLRGVVGYTLPHEHGAQIGIAQSQRPEQEALLRNSPTWEGGHQHADFQHDGPEAHRVAEVFEVEPTIRGVEFAQVQGCEVAGGIVEENIFRAGIRRIDPTILGAGVPLVDRRVVLRAWISTDPGSPGDLIPELAGLDGLSDFAVCAALQRPDSILLQSFEEAIRNPHAVVGILA